MTTDNDSDAAVKSLDQLPFYTEALEQVRPLKRPVLLWSAASLVFVHGDLHINSTTMRGIQVSGVTDEKLALFFLLAVSYYLLRWLWGNWVALRTYWRDGILCHLWRAATVADFTIGFTDAQNDPDLSMTRFMHRDTANIRVIVNNRRLKTDVEDVAKSYRTSRLTVFLSFYGVPFLFPLFVALWAMLVLWCRL